VTTQLLAAGNSTADSADITVDDTTQRVSVHISNGANALPFDAEAIVSVKETTGNTYTELLRLSKANPMAVLVGPGVYRVTRVSPKSGSNFTIAVYRS
jgi:hypothetical protein